MKSYNMPVSKKEVLTNGEKGYVVVGEVQLFYPLLSELGFDINPTSWEQEVVLKDGGREWKPCQEADLNSLPVYEDEKHAYVWSAVWAACKAKARNCLQTGSAVLKEGVSIPDSIEALLATGERSGEALKTRREYFASFKAWLPSLGKAAAFNTAVYDIVSNVKNIQYQTAKRKANILQLITDHAASLAAEDAARFERIIVQIGEACETAEELSDF